MFWGYGRVWLGFGPGRVGFELKSLTGISPHAAAGFAGFAVGFDVGL